MTDTLRPAQPVEVNTDIAFSAGITLPGDTGSSLIITAYKGTQAVGIHCGPLDATNPGPVRLTVFGDDGETAKLTIPWETAQILARTLHTAVGAADTRDYRNDKPRQEIL